LRASWSARRRRCCVIPPAARHRCG
jgi:hypothetical protein